jgi:hypothetical protein
MAGVGDRDRAIGAMNMRVFRPFGPGKPDRGVARGLARGGHECPWPPVNQKEEET